MAIKNVSKEDILREVKIIDIVDEFGLDLEPISSGNFDCRCRCPSSEHKHGSERTPSLYIDSVNNNFYCFGCTASSNCLDFYMICAGVSFSDALSVLRKRVANPTGTSIAQSSVQDIIPKILNISNLFRSTMLEHPNDLRWINNLMMQTDKHMSAIKKTESEKVDALYKKIKKVINERYK